MVLPRGGQAGKGDGRRVQPGGGQLPPERQWAEEMNYGVDYGPLGGGYNWQSDDAWMGRKDAPPPTPEEVQAFRDKTLQQEAKQGGGRYRRGLAQLAGALRGVPQYGPPPGPSWHQPGMPPYFQPLMNQMGRPQFGGFNQPMRQPQYGMGGMGMMPMGGMNQGIWGGGYAPSYNAFQQQNRGGMSGGGLGSVQSNQYNTFGRGGAGWGGNV